MDSSYYNEKKKEKFHELKEYMEKNNITLSITFIKEILDAVAWDETLKIEDLIKTTLVKNE